jgi:hypothetical protein
MLRLGVRLLGSAVEDIMAAGAMEVRAGACPNSVTEVAGDARIHALLVVALVTNLIAIPAAFAVENMLAPWQVRMEVTTPGWCFMMAQAAVIGFVAALVVRGKVLAVAEGLLAATLLGYAYVLANLWLIEAHRGLQYTHLVFRGVELGMVALAALLVGVATRQILRERLLFAGEQPSGSGRQYGLGDLLFLIAAYSVALALVNLFFNHFHRETQIRDVSVAAVRTLPAALPWVWGVTQRRLSSAALATIVLMTLIVMGVKILVVYAVTGDEIGLVVEQAGRRAAAYAFGGTFNGLLLRGLGFSWQHA